LICLSGFDFLNHVLFLLFCTRLLAGHPKASGACSPGQGLLFAGEPRNFALSFCFLGGTANPEGGEAEAEARSAASAQASFPARRAREKKGVEKEKGERNQSRTAKREIRPLVVHSIKGKRLERGYYCIGRVLSGHPKPANGDALRRRANRRLARAGVSPFRGGPPLESAHEHEYVDRICAKPTRQMGNVSAP
jgi:hypothetical protein